MVGEGAQGGLGHRVDDVGRDQLARRRGRRSRRGSLVPVLAHSGRCGRAPASRSASQRSSAKRVAVAARRRGWALAIATRPRRSESGGQQRRRPWRRRARRRTRPPRRCASTGSPAATRRSRPREVGVDDLLVARDGEEQRDVDVDAARGELLDRRDAGLGGRDLDHHVGPGEARPQLERLLDRRRRCRRRGRACTRRRRTRRGRRSRRRRGAAGRRRAATSSSASAKNSSCGSRDAGGDGARGAGRRSGPSR